LFDIPATILYPGNRLMKNNKEILNGFIKEAKNDKNVLGFLLIGSRGKNQETKFSDYDIGIIVKDKVANSYKKKYELKNSPPFDFSVFSISEFRNYAEIGSPFEWDRASFTHVKAIIDKTGEIQKLIDEKGKIPNDRIKNYVSSRLDAYINQVYRSLKCFRDSNPACARLEASRSVHLFLDIIFGLEGRITPYYKYLNSLELSLGYQVFVFVRF
jgi:predicted nucleotidyltransferase